MFVEVGRQLGARSGDPRRDEPGFVVVLGDFVQSQKSGVGRFIADQVKRWDIDVADRAHRAQHRPRPAIYPLQRHADRRPGRFGLARAGAGVEILVSGKGETMDRFWLKSYPPGVPADIDPSVYPSLVSLLEESFAKYRDAEAYVCMGKAITFGEIDTLSKALAAWLQGRGLQARRARGDHDAQRAAVSRRGRGGAARRLHRGQRQSALHRARARASAGGFRRRGGDRAGELRRDPAAGAGAARRSSTSSSPRWATCWVSPRA